MTAQSADSAAKSPGVSPQEIEALNRHGVFFKKRVLSELRGIDGLDFFSEEFGVTFGSPTAIDLIAFERRQDRLLLFVFECKRAYTKQKTWLFFRDIDTRFRVCRLASIMGASGCYSKDVPPLEGLSVCSEGYEMVTVNGTCKADQNPIFEAANQLSRGFLGFSLLRKQQRDRSVGFNQPVDCVVPVLATTAQLRVANLNTLSVSLSTGNLTGDLQCHNADWLVLKHPFALESGGDLKDFRSDPTNAADLDHWGQIYRESLFVVRAEKLRHFLSNSFRDYLAGLK